MEKLYCYYYYYWITPREHAYGIEAIIKYIKCSSPRLAIDY